MTRGAIRGSKTNKTQWPILVFVSAMCLPSGVATVIYSDHHLSHKLQLAGICSCVASIIYAADAYLCFNWSR
ncbi:unnamed protein product [Acanthoscelides obtectus]|nr:unnamed protein product [Acanthoscelides obtectus]CAK1662248.1 hypothetical protein AOBTE_LOCUS23054 [Acanthoscelides obtectus]